MKGGVNLTTGRWTRSLRTFSVIAIREWKRCAFTSSFIFLAFIPPLVIAVYPSTYELITDKIRDWNKEQDRRLRPTRTASRLSTDSNIYSSETNAVRYSVIDHSPWVHQKVKEKVLRNDIREFLDALSTLDESQFAQWAQGTTDQLDDADLIRDRAHFQQNLIEFHRTLIDEGQIRERTIELAERLEAVDGANTIDFPADSVRVLWTKFPEQIVELAPLVSLVFFQEIDVEEKSIDRVQSLLDSREISGYFIIPSSVLQDSDGLQLVALQDTPRSIVDELKTFYQSLLRDIVREQKLIEPAGSPGDEVPFVQITWNEIELSRVRMDTNRFRHQGWGSPTRLENFVSSHLAVVVAFMVLFGVISSGPVFALSTIEERSSKLAETLLANTSSKLIFDAKVWGGLASFVSIFGCWLMIRVIYLLVVTPDVPFEILPNLHTIHLMHWTFFLLLALSFYGYIVVALGSMCNNQIDLIAFALPLFLIFGIAANVMFGLFENPSSLASSVLSFVPPFTSFLMIGRTGALPPWPIYLTISVLLLVSVIGVRELGSLLFSRAILLEKKPRGIKDVVRIVQNPE